MGPRAAPPRKAAELFGVPVAPRTARDRIVLTAIAARQARPVVAALVEHH